MNDMENHTQLFHSLPINRGSAAAASIQRNITEFVIEAVFLQNIRFITHIYMATNENKKN